MSPHRPDLSDTFHCEGCDRRCADLGPCEHGNRCVQCSGECGECREWDIAPGFYPDVPEAEYHADRQSLSHSGIKTLLKHSPRKFRYRLDHPEHKDVFDFGSAAHALLLGKGIENVYVAPFDSWRSKASQAERDAARDAGLSPILPSDWQVVCDMAEELSRHRMAVSLLTSGQSEVSAYATDERTGVLRRCRYDHLLDDLAVDYKTAASSDPAEFKWAAKRYGYHGQAAYYLDIAETLGRRLRGFLFVVQEKEPPYIVTVIQLPPWLVDEGRALNDRGLEMFRDCTEANLWPGYVPDDQIAMPD